MTHITSIAQLRALYDPVRERSAKKEIPELDAHCQAFVARSPLVVVDTHSVGVMAQADTAHPRQGYVTDHLEPQALHNGNVDVYLCGPPPMVDAVQKHFKAAGITPASFHYEKFSANVAAVPA